MFQKYDWEERFRYFQFKRTDGQDGLAIGEVLASITSVTCVEVSSPYLDRSSDMIGDYAMWLSTQVVYLLKGGTSGRNYIITIRAVTNLGQKLEGVVYIGVL